MILFGFLHELLLFSGETRAPTSLGALVCDKAYFLKASLIFSPACLRLALA